VISLPPITTNDNADTGIHAADAHADNYLLTAMMIIPRTITTKRLAEELVQLRKEGVRHIPFGGGIGYFALRDVYSALALGLIGNSANVLKGTGCS
jgi:hypothetical protein